MLLSIMPVASPTREYVNEEVKAVVFNLGYLPKGNHEIMTTPETTIVAIEKSLELLSDDGIIAVIIYHGGDSGFHERDELIKYFERLNMSSIKRVSNELAINVEELLQVKYKLLPEPQYALIADSTVYVTICVNIFSRNGIAIFAPLFFPIGTISTDNAFLHTGQLPNGFNAISFS